MDIVAHNREAWDRQVAQDNEWTRPVGPDVIERARHGDWSIVLIGHAPVPREWFPASLAGVDLLALASGGGQQAPVLAAAGATVTSFDNSPAQLARDAEVASREGLSIRLEQGDMADLSRFPDASFDLIFHPVSNLFVPDVRVVWRECFRVLRPGGLLLAGFLNPDLYIFDADALDNRGEFVVRHALPYSDLTHLTQEERDRLFGPGSTVEWSHTLSDQIGGQLEAGFLLSAFQEAPHHAGPTGRYLPGYFATRAIKPTH
ncbi:class I SAM-dependent methyltransferase [Luedemannella flava]|uniref:Class I SAM-dependent methyltransferase n=1 Tax=Luedemannella flava TaxID=349316 RepID=A0ABN2LH24_9ACTN